MPARKPGVWELSVMRDGRPGRLGSLRLCLDAAADARLGVFGRRLGADECQQTVTRDAAGVYHFASSCALREGGVATARGAVKGDFTSDYDVDAQVDVTGAAFDPMNGAHAIRIAGRYQGPCPADLRPGEVSVGAGLKFNMDRLPQITQAIDGG
jgi:hypothetical protein